jgi:hypothetical protein
VRSLNQAVDDYLALRRSLGFKLREYGECLHEFVSFLKKNGSAHITNKLALEYVTRRQHEKPVSWSRRLIIIRGFARYRFGADPNTEIPPIGLLRFRSRRAQPYIYSHDEVCRLLQGALKIESPHKLQPHTYHCLFGLLAVSGLDWVKRSVFNRRMWIGQREFLRSGESSARHALFHCILRRSQCCATMLSSARESSTGTSCQRFW